MIGGTLARLLVERGHQVQVGTRSTDDPRVAALPPVVGRTTPAGASRFGIATVAAVPFAAWPDLAQVLGAGVEGREILDTSNAIPGRDGPRAEEALLSGEGSGVAVARLTSELSNPVAADANATSIQAISVA